MGKLPPDNTRRAVVSIHGIRTRGKWQKDLVPFLSNAGFTPIPMDYGFFWAIFLLIPFMRRRKIDWFRAEYAAKTKDYAEVHIIAHSFGTYLVARAMEIYDQVRCDRMIVCGSIIRRDYPWAHIRERDQVSNVLNDYGRLDVWSRFVEWFVKDAGASGVFGFDIPEDRPFLLQRAHSEFRHSDYFFAENYTGRWIPFLKTGKIAADKPLPPPRTNVRYLVTVGIVLLALVLTGREFIRRLPSFRGGTQQTDTSATDTGVTGTVTTDTSAASTGPTDTAPMERDPALPPVVEMAGCECESRGTAAEPVGSCECSTPGTFQWTRIPNVHSVELIACGGGGGGGQGGGAGNGGFDNAGGGGGGEGGAVFAVRLVDLNAATYSVSVGAGGAGGAGSGAAPGQNGTASSFGVGTGTFRVVPLAEGTPPMPPFAKTLIFDGGGGGGEGGHAFQFAPNLDYSKLGQGGNIGLGADGGDGHGPASNTGQRSESGADSPYAMGGPGSGNCTINLRSGGSGGGGGAGLERGGTGGCGGACAGAKPGQAGGRGAGGGGGGAYGECDRVGEAGGRGGDGYVLIRW